MDYRKIRDQALQEIEEEDFREEVDKIKVKLRQRRTIWDRVFPYKILVIKKEAVCQ